MATFTIEVDEDGRTHWTLSAPVGQVLARSDQRFGSVEESRRDVEAYKAEHPQHADADVIEHGETLPRI